MIGYDPRPSAGFPQYRAIPFRDSSQRGVSHPFALFSKGIAPVSLRYPFWGGGGYRTSTSHALHGGNAQTGGRGYRTQLAMLRHQNQKNPRVRKICVRNSGAGNGCANFMDAWKNAFFLQEKPMSIKFLVLGGGAFWVWGGGGSADFIFIGRGDHSD